nr:RNA polymerase beta'' subunit [Ostreobium quekettii]
MNNSLLFFNRCFDKKRLINFILWFFSKYGERETIQLIESLKNIGFKYATKAGISIGIDDLKIPFIKPDCINITEQKIKDAEINYQIGNITEIERQQKFVDEWSFVSEKLKRHVIQFFKATDIFNPIYMMAFSGARGNISQIRQLIGMRGLMADPQGQILDFPIRSSFREGLTLTEYLISCYGARKGVVDTALRTATSGYLTRRLVDVTQQVVVGGQNCNTNRGIQFTDLKDGSKTLLSLKDRIVGRVLLHDIFVLDSIKNKKYKIGEKNQEISPRLARKIDNKNSRIFLRSPLTCHSKNSVCQLCYGWNLAYNAIVSIGEAVGVLAAQSIGEPGTQLTMRTFHTGGVFTGGLIDQIYAPFGGEVNYLNNFTGVLIRTLKGRIGFLTKSEGALQIKAWDFKKLNNPAFSSKMELTHLFFSSQLSLKKNKIQYLLRKISSVEKNLKTIKNISHPILIFNIPVHTILFTRHGGSIVEKELIAELSSISISDNRSQETEQEIFTPIAGQIFFENLILIEKTKRDGSIQKIAYGLGSLWVVSTTEWRSLINPKIFPSHGDFISKSSVVQNLQIRLEKFYCFDKYISDAMWDFKKLKTDVYLISKNSGVSQRLNIFDKISLNREFYSNNFQKIYYQNFRYFASINLKINCLKNPLYFETNNLAIRDQFIKNKKPKNNHRLFGLNFRFYQNNPIFRIQKQKYKSNFLLYSLQTNEKQINHGTFYSLLILYNPIKLKLKQPITSRKRIAFQNKNIYQYWSNFYRLKLTWVFASKNLVKNFDFLLSKRNNSLYPFKHYLFKRKKTKTEQRKKGIIYFQKYKICKFFSNTPLSNSFFFNFHSAINQYNFRAEAQFASTLVNRQFCTSQQLSKFWCSPKKNNFQLFASNHTKLDVNELWKLLPDTPYFNTGKYYNINSIIKPILINPLLLVDSYIKKFYLQSYIIQNFLISFYYEYFLNLKYNSYFFNSFLKENKKIGFQIQFKVSTTPVLINIKNNYFKIPSKIKQIFFKNEIFTTLQKNKLLLPSLKKQQNYISWPCTYQKGRYFDKFGYLLNFGMEFKNNTYFDRQLILIDIIYNNTIYKFNLLKIFSHKCFHRLKLRFSAHRFLTKNLLIFQKVENYINTKSYYTQILNLNKSYKNQDYHQSLAFNSIQNYPINFNNHPIKNSNSFNLIYLDNLNNFFNKKIFFKTGFLENIQVKTKTLFNLEYPIFINAYYPLTKKRTKIFNFNTLKKQKNQLYSYIFSYSIGSNFASKVCSFNSVQKLDIQSLLDENSQPINKIKVFYKKFKYSTNSNFICIDFLSPSTDSEIIYAKSKKQKQERNFVVLTRSNLKTFVLENRKLYMKTKNFRLGDFLRYGTKFENQKVVSEGGQIIYINKRIFTIRQASPFLITSKSLVNVSQDEIVVKGSRLFTFLSHRVKTGDIIQGIPRIEEFFEARLTRDGLPLRTNLHTQIQQLFQVYNSKLPLFEAAQKSFEKIQYLIIDEIQKVYCSQGIYIADKHLEIVVRQMTSKVQIIKGGQTGLLSGELVEFDWIRLIEQKFGSSEIVYEPIVLGITKSCLETESFISAASFQETTRILTKAAIQNKIDFIRGLKQNVILGNLIPAGTGFFSPLYFKYSKLDR